MSGGWCPACRSEWWTNVTSCPDCGTALVDDEPPPPVDPESTRDHTLIEIDLAALDRAQLWALRLLLEQAGVATDWRDTTIVLAAAQRPVVDEYVASLGAAAPDDIGAALPDPANPGATVGSIPRRFGAYLLDALIVGVVATPISLIWTTTTMHGNHTTTAPTVAASWVIFGLALLYPILAIGATGRTVGLAVLELRVTARAGGAPGWPQSLVRAAVAAGSAIAWVPAGVLLPSAAAAWVPLVWHLAVYGWVFVDTQRRGLHDIAAGTVVLHVPRPRRKRSHVDFDD